MFKAIVNKLFISIQIIVNSVYSYITVTNIDFDLNTSPSGDVMFNIFQTTKKQRRVAQGNVDLPLLIVEVQSMMSNLSAITLFLSSTAMSMFFSHLHRKKMIDRAYIETLSNLFQVVKGPPRHSDLNADLAARKRVFNDACNRHGLAIGNVIHVAGTKGKGSTVEYIASGLRAQGFNVGVFTSPHLHTARERIKIGRDIISKEDFTRCGNAAMMELYGKPWAVFFDLLLLTAIQYFGSKRVDYIILETGIGGRYDSTNFIESPTVAVITSISLDHQV